MSPNYYLALLSVVIVSFISLIGVFFILVKKKTLEKISLYLVSFAVGALFGDVLIHLLPEAYENIESEILTAVLVMVGLFIFFIVEKFLRWRHCHTPQCEHHPAVINSLIGDSVHNFIDGLLIGASYLVSIPLGVATTLAIVFHEIPHEIGNLSIYIHKGMESRKALFVNFLSALTAVFGTLIALIIGLNTQNFSLYLLPVTAGGFIYIAGSDLIPELHEEIKPILSLWQLLFMILGFILMLAITFFE